MPKEFERLAHLSQQLIQNILQSLQLTTEGSAASAGAPPVTAGIDAAAVETDEFDDLDNLRDGEDFAQANPLITKLFDVDVISGGSLPPMYHVTGAAKHAEYIMENINIEVSDPNGRFGKGFYITNEISTAHAELKQHGKEPVDTLIFNISGGNLIDLTHVSYRMYARDSNFAKLARRYAFVKNKNGLIFQSQRGSGLNAVFFRDVNAVLGKGRLVPKEVAKAKVAAEST